MSSISDSNSNSVNRCFHIVSWNVRGLGDSDKCQVVRNVFSNAKPSFICIQESKLAHFNIFKAQTFLPQPFSSSFVSVPAEGTRGGLITAWDPTLFSLTSHQSNNYCLTTSFTCNASACDLSITNVYGLSDHRFSTPFLQSLGDVRNLIHGPWILIGDFNLTRCAADKSNGQFNASLADEFNNPILQLLVSEIPLTDRCFTWSNKQAFPILARLDRAFTNVALDLVFPMTSLSSLPRPTSDHTPLLLSLSSNIPKPNFFKLDNYLLKKNNFLASVIQGWLQPLLAVTRRGNWWHASKRQELRQRFGNSVSGRPLKSSIIANSLSSCSITLRNIRPYPRRSFRSGTKLGTNCTKKSRSELITRDNAARKGG